MCQPTAGKSSAPPIPGIYRESIILGWFSDRKIPPRIVRFSPRIWHFSYMRELLFSQPREKTNILVETRIAFLGRELLLGKSTKNSLNLWQTRITQRNVILVGIVWESLILVWFLDENYIKPRRELSFSLLENDNSRLNIVILPLIRGENHVIRGTITVSVCCASGNVFSQEGFPYD